MLKERASNPYILGMDLKSGRVKEMDRESETPPSEKIEEMMMMDKKKVPGCSSITIQ
jgi:hypothetical protein